MTKPTPDDKIVSVDRLGWWLVQGLRHSAYAFALTAEEAIRKAHDAGLVDKTWEYPKAKFAWEKCPDVF